MTHRQAPFEVRVGGQVRVALVARYGILLLMFPLSLEVRMGLDRVELVMALALTEYQEWVS